MTTNEKNRMEQPRDIKFRGKRKSDGNWLYGCLINNVFHNMDQNEACCYIIDLDVLGEYYDWEDIFQQLDELQVIPESVGQYTGVKDVASTEIYENDYILHGQSQRVVKYRGCNWHAIRVSGDETILLTFSENPKVVGNTTDHSEFPHHPTKGGGR